MKGTDSYNSTKKATEFWNNQNGKYEYTVIETDGTKTVYDVVFDFKIKETANKLDAQGLASDDPTGNSSLVFPNEAVVDSKTGEKILGATTYGEFTETSESRKDTDTPAHEIGHTLNLGHFDHGIMEEITMKGKTSDGKERSQTTSVDYIQQIIDYAVGESAKYSTTTPITIANTELKNTQGVKTKVTVTLSKARPQEKQSER